MGYNSSYQFHLQSPYGNSNTSAMRHPLCSYTKRGYRFRQETWYTSYHLGEDYVAPKGKEIYAPVAGVAMHQEGTQCGRAVYLLGDDRKCHRLMHMSARACKHGERVAEGQVVGYVGNTGYSTAPHLHWDVFNGDHVPTGKEINIDNFLDPEKYLELNQKPMTTKEKLLAIYEELGQLRLKSMELETTLNETIGKLLINTQEQTVLRAKEKELLNQLT